MDQAQHAVPSLSRLTVGFWILRFCHNITTVKKITLFKNKSGHIQNIQTKYRINAIFQTVSGESHLNQLFTLIPYNTFS